MKVTKNTSSRNPSPTKSAPSVHTKPARFRFRHRGPIASLGVVTLAAATFANAQPAAAQPLDPAAAMAQASAEKDSHRRFAGAPTGPNPFLSFLPAEAKPDFLGWQRWLAEQGKAKRTLQPPADPTKLVGIGETESNDTQATANFVPAFGTGTGDDASADVTGTVAAPPPPTIVGPFGEDNGSIPLAISLMVPSGTTRRTSGSIGDGPHGSSGTGSGDFDFFNLGTLNAGDEILIDMDTPMPFCCDLDPWVNVWDAAGNLLAFNDDSPGTYDSYLVFAVPSTAVYYVSIGAYQSPYPSDRFNSASGPGTATEGTYDATIGVNALDRDFFSFDLDPGDVIAANLVGTLGTRLELIDPAGTQRLNTSLNPASITPGPFPAGGVSGFAYVADSAGTWRAKVGNQAGAYTLELRAFRPPLEVGVLGGAQTLFVDFDGVTIDQAIFGGGGMVTLSPLSSFLAGWGLTPADESALIDGILAVLAENLSTDMRVALNGDYDASLNPGDFDIVILNSRDHADPFGNPSVSRLIIGGTISELGISTIGIAESVDPGNFDTTETAVVLLDLLSAAASNPNSLNQFPLGGGATQLDLVATGVGNIAAHEAGHFFANWHTLNSNALSNIMDQGGNLANTVGVGTDSTFGTGDDVDSDFGLDTFANEGISQGGLEDTLNAVAFGLSTGAANCAPVPTGVCRSASKGKLQLKDKAVDALDLLSFSWTNGAATTLAELGDPRVDNQYRICVYDAGGLVRSATAPAGGLCRGRACWKQTGPTSSPNGYVYRDGDLTPSGTSTATIRSGTVFKSKVLWKAKGVPLDDGALGLVPPVTVEVVQSDPSICFGHTFMAGDITTNTAAEFKATLP